MPTAMRHPHLLFVDDCAELRAIYSVAFTLAGYQVFQAGNGLEAIKAVEENAFDAIIMDMEMPHMDGVEATQRIRSLSTGCHVPILVCTGYPERNYEAQARAAGANAVVYKPIAPPQLVARMDDLCRAEN